MITTTTIRPEDTGSTRTIDDAVLVARHRGELIRPNDPGYDQARALYNAMIDKKPALIARCLDEADVIACVNFAREEEIPLAVRGGGHSGPGLGSCDGGLVIDLSMMRGVTVDPDWRTAKVKGGTVWSEVDQATHPFGLAACSGVISSTGVGGLTLGGGIGHLSRKYGLAIDNLLSAEVVLADGTLVTANALENLNLFWALRGGGGNFGVVTSFTFQLHPVTDVTAGPMFWSLEDAPEVMRRYEKFITDAPEEINGFFAFMTVPPVPLFPEELHMKKVCAIVWCSTENVDRTADMLAEVSNWPKPLFTGIGTVPFPALQSLFDGLYPPGLQWYWKADFVDTLDEKAIEEHCRFGEELPTMHSTMHLYPVNGAVHRVGAKDTAFSFRTAKWAKVIVGVDPDPVNKERITDWAKAYWAALHPYSAQGAYINFMMEEGTNRIQATYGANYTKLRMVKAKYDPNNLFRLNQNIPPAES